MTNSLSTQGRFYCGLSILTADGLFFLVAIFFILGGECWHLAPVIGPSPATDKPGALFDAYTKDAAENDKVFAADRKRDFEALYNIAAKAPDPKLDNLKTMSMLWGAAAGRDTAQADTNRVLVQSYRKKYDEALAKENAATLERARYWQGWILSIVFLIVLVLTAGGIGWAGLRFLGSAALPGSVFEKPSPAAMSSPEDNRITTG